MKRFTALVAALLLAVMTYAQPIVTSVGNLTVCTDTLVVPVEVVKVTNVGAISLVLEFDNNVLNFVGSQNPHPALSVGYSTVVNQAGSKIYFSWHSVAPLNILQGTLLEYVFTSAGGYSDLTWDVNTQAACEYSDVNTNVLAATFVDGSVTVVPDPMITSNPAAVTLEEGQNASFAIAASNATAYQWQVSTDGGLTWTDVSNTLPYIGADQANLQILAVPVTFNQYQYRCIAAGMCSPDAISAPALLTVAPIITASIGSYSFCADEIIVPVDVTHFYGVAGVSLTLGYNSVVLNYNGVHSTNPLLAGGTFIDNSYLGKVFISWFSLTPVDLGDDVLLELAFTSSSPGTSALVWDLTLADNCQFNNIASDNITSIFVDGSVTVLPTPFKYNMTGGGEYCQGGQGVMIGLAFSQIGVNYDLLLNGTYVKTVAGTGTALSFGYQTAAGTYTVYAVNANSGCDMNMTGSKTITINPLPVAEAGADDIMLSGTSTTLSGSATGGTPGYNYSWTPGGMSTQSVNVSPAATQTYTLLVTDSKGCADSDDVTITVYMNTIQGQVTYNNMQQTPMAGVTVYLQDVSGVKSTLSDITDANGNYSFPELPNGTYELWASHNGTWGGVNSTDALAIMQHFILLHPITDPLKVEASDVDASGYVNSTDAFQTASRFVQNITSFAAGDWAFEEKQVTLNMDNYVDVDLKGICYGDANGSYIPNLKASSLVSLTQQGTMNTLAAKTLEIPVIAESAMEVGAISLEMRIPANLKVTAVTVGQEQASIHQDGQNLSISWFNTNAIRLEQGNVMMRISGLTQGAVEGNFSLLNGEIADGRARVIQNAGLQMPKMTQAYTALSLSNYPNPFSTNTSIQFNLPDAGQVSITVWNLLGEKVAEVANSAYEAGSYNLPFDGTQLVPGMYHYKMEVNGETTSRTMIRIR